jgi:hypothetical protein
MNTAARVKSAARPTPRKASVPDASVRRGRGYAPPANGRASALRSAASSERPVAADRGVTTLQRDWSRATATTRFPSVWSDQAAMAGSGVFGI